MYFLLLLTAIELQVTEPKQQALMFKKKLLDLLEFKLSESEATKISGHIKKSFIERERNEPHSSLN